jgi:hypothetical protein
MSRHPKVSVRQTGRPVTAPRGREGASRWPQPAPRTRRTRGAAGR